MMMTSTKCYSMKWPTPLLALGPGTAPTGFESLESSVMRAAEPITMLLRTTKRGGWGCAHRATNLFGSDGPTAPPRVRNVIPDFTATF